MWRLSVDRSLDLTYAALAAAAFFGFPIVALLPVVLGTGSRPISIVYRGAVLAASLAYAWGASRAQRPALPAPIRWALGLLATMLIARFAWDSLCAALPIDIDWDYLWGQVVVFNLGPVLPFLFAPGRNALNAAHKWCVWVGLVSVVAIGLGAALSFHHVQHGGRLSTDVMNPISVGLVGVSLFVVCLSTQGTEARSARAWWFTVARVAGGVTGVALCVLSASKGPLLGLVVVASAMFAYRFAKLQPRRRFIELFVALIIVTTLVVVMIALAQHGLLAIYGRLSEAGSSNDHSTAWRVQAWTGALAQFDGSPLWGSGAVELTTRFYPHNFILESMIATGVTGFLLLLYLLLLGFVAAHRMLSDAPALSWISLLFIESVIASLVSGSLYISATLWIPLLMVLGSYQARIVAGQYVNPSQSQEAHP